MLRGLKLSLISVFVVAVTVALAYVLGGEAGQYIGEYRAEREYLKRRTKDSEELLAGANRQIVGEKLPDHQFQDISGNIVLLSDLLKQKTVVSFVSSNCEGCLQQAEKIAAVARDSADFACFIMIALNEIDELAAFREEVNLMCPLLYDHNGEYVTKFFNNYVTPTSMIVNESGIVESVVAGHLTDREINEVMDYNRD
ncbi:MAG: TlpA family protein disulfide reductase [Candidatus Zixiibacteriota bacterium]|nr:MAG: TlpA family protein disulfide reductase [candidate division Zixibacteria bacterium]